MKVVKKKSPKATAKKKSWIRKAVKAVWIIFIVIALTVPLYFYTVSIDLFGLYGGMPSLREIENPEIDLSTEIISADGVSLGRLGLYNRSMVKYDQLSPILVRTLIISEDHRFYEHSGIDLQAIPRVLWGLITFNNAGGGSTITQQLAKNLYTLNPGLDGRIATLGKYPQRLVRKSKEWIISVNLEESYTKEEIIAMYLNTFDFTNNAHGIKVAAETYFDKQPDQLNIQESAMLVGMLQNPNAFNPRTKPDAAISKRNQVLQKLFDHNYFQRKEEYDSIVALPIELRFSIQDHNKGLAQYFRSILAKEMKVWCKEHGYNLYQSGLKIYTTIDSRMQQFAEQAMVDRMTTLQRDFENAWKRENKNPWVDDDGNEIKDFLSRKLKRTETYRSLVKQYGENNDSVNIILNRRKPMQIFTWNGEKDTLFNVMDSLRYYTRFLHAGLVSMDPRSGAIKAWVGGINHKFFQFDHVQESKRQPGSTFKPFVYGKALEDGYSPCQEFIDTSPSIKLPDGSYWSPNNSDGTKGSGDKFTMRKGLALSKNTISAQLIDRLNPQNVVDFAHKLGIKSELNPVPSLCLGTSEVSLFEMVSAYSTFVNQGINIAPFYITKIEDKNGNVVANFVPKMYQALSEQTAYKITHMLQGVTLEGSSSQAISPSLKEDNEMGGKTGTTSNASDGWFIGITHNLVTGVWVGGDERTIHFPSWSFGQGARTALPIWDKFMLKVYEHPETGYKKGLFKRPEEPLDMNIECEDEPEVVIPY